MVNLRRYKHTYRSFILFLFSLTLFSKIVFGETVTTGNLLPNKNDGVDWNSSSTDMINDGGSGYVSNNSTFNGFTITCPTGQANCGYKYDVGGDFEVTGTATVTADDIALTNNSINQSMLDNGITLNSNISGLNSISGTTINATSTLTENNVRVATQPFAIAQSIALG